MPVQVVHAHPALPCDGALKDFANGHRLDVADLGAVYVANCIKVRAELGPMSAAVMAPMVATDSSPAKLTRRVGGFKVGHYPATPPRR